MSHFFMIPANENGIVLDNYLVDDLRGLWMRLSTSPTCSSTRTAGGRTHRGRCRTTTGSRSASRNLCGRSRSPTRTPAEVTSLGIGIHWPSMLTDDSGSIRNYLEAVTFYTMEKRADNIGENAGYMILRSLFEAVRIPAGSTWSDTVSAARSSCRCCRQSPRTASGVRRT